MGEYVSVRGFTLVELCAGAGGQALGLELAGFEHEALVEIDRHAVATLRLNRPDWNIVEGDVKDFSGLPHRGLDLLSAGVPCPPFSKAGKQLGQDDDRDLFPEALRIVEETEPSAVMFENVRGLLDDQFAEYRTALNGRLESLGYRVFWRLLNAVDFGVPQLRPRVVIVGLKPPYAEHFVWPDPLKQRLVTVGDALHSEMVSRGWQGADAWRSNAQTIAPTLVGGSKKHGGPDLGPTRAKRAWAKLGVNGHTIAEEPPEMDFEGLPRLTIKMAATIQGFPETWGFSGRKTAAYRQVGNAFPPPVARAVGLSIRHALEMQGVKNPPPVRSTEQASQTHFFAKLAS